MRKETLLNNIKNPANIGKAQIADIQIDLQAFPYFQTLQLLYTTGLYNTDSIHFNKQLRKAAAYSGNRKLLFKLISENIKEKEEKGIEIKLEKTKEIQKPEQKLKIGKPLEFTEQEIHSFSKWLSLTKVKKINKKESNKNLVDTFIEQEPKISKTKKQEFFGPMQSAKEGLIENNELVTETLARVYLEQEHYDKAILAYKKLSLKYPQKNSFFANQIKLIHDLKEQ
jgi:hypothetical protein